MEEQLGEITRQLRSLRDAMPGAEAPQPREQERLKVES
jgi:hypothetical protein